MRLQEAVDVFCEGFAFTRSFTHPYEVVQIGPLSVMRDTPRRRGNYRAEEIVVCGSSPRAVCEAIENYNPPRHFLCVVSPNDQSPQQVRDAYKTRGYRLLRSEPLMIRSLDQVPNFQGPLQIDRVDSIEIADKLAKVARVRQILPEHLGIQNAPIRLYYAHFGGTAAGWVRSIPAGDRASWVSNMFVEAEYRRKGIATSLMIAMLQDDQRHGVQTSVLLASEAGSRLYETLGYQKIALLQLFAPSNQRPG